MKTTKIKIQTVSCILILTSLLPATTVIADDDTIKADGQIATPMRGRGLTLEGILTRNNGEIQSGGSFTLEGELVRIDSSSMTEKQLDAIIAAKRKANARLIGKDKRSLTLVTFDKEGNALPGGSQLLDFNTDDLPTLISFDLNDDSIDDLVVFHKNKDSFTGLIEKSDGTFDLWLDLKPDTNLIELANKTENNDALLFDPAVEDKDNSTDNDEDDNNTGNDDLRTVAALLQVIVDMFDSSDIKLDRQQPLTIVIDDFDNDGMLDISIETDRKTQELTVIFSNKTNKE